MGKFDTHGGYFAPKNYFRINTGGSHEENPYGGVQVGVDQNGTPNLLEEGEPVYKDFVFSDNIKANKSILKEFVIPEKYAGKLYSEIADSFIEEAEQRPTDNISKNGLEAMLGRLADAQEEQKLRKEESELKSELNKLSPEELAMLAQSMGQANTEEVPVEQPQMMPQEQMAMEPQQQAYAQQGIPMMANGGLLNRYDTGGDVNISDDGNTESERKINWERLGMIGTGVAGGATLGAVSGAPAAGIGAIPGAILGAISGGILGNDLYNQDAFGIATDVLLPGVGKGLYSSATKILGKGLRAMPLKQVESAARKAATTALKHDAKKEAVNAAETELKMAADKFKINSTKLSKAQATIEKLVGKEELTAAEKEALKAAETSYTEAAKNISKLDKDVTKATRQVNRANSRLWWSDRKNPLPVIANAVQKTDQAVWKPMKYVFDPSTSARGSVAGHIAHSVGVLGNDAFIIGGRYLLPSDSMLIDYSDKQPVNTKTPAIQTTVTPTVEEIEYPFAYGGKMNLFNKGGKGNAINGFSIYPGGYMWNSAAKTEAETATQIPITYLPYNNSNGFMYFNAEAGDYDKGYLDWLKSEKFADNDVFGKLSDYYKNVTGRTLTKDNAIRLGQDKKFGKFHDILGQAYTNYLNSARKRTTLPTIATKPTLLDNSTFNVSSIGAGNPDTVFGLMKTVTVDGKPVQISIPTEQNPSAGTKIQLSSFVDASGKVHTIGQQSANTKSAELDALAESDNIQALLDANQEAIIDQLNAGNSYNGEETYPTWPRYAGAVNNLIAAGYNLAQDPDRYVYQSLNSYLPEGSMPLLMQRYIPTDVSLPMQAVRAQGLATARDIMNSGAGASAGQLMLANGFNTANAVGNTLLQGRLANEQQRNSIIGANNQSIARMSDFDANLSARRAEILNRIAMQNQQRALHIAMLNNQAEQAKASAVGVSIDNAAKGLAGIGNENFAMNQINTNPYLLRHIRPDGTSTYSGKYGGMLRKYKK